MASVVLAIGVAIYLTAEKVRDRREKKRVIKARALQDTLGEDLSITDDVMAQSQVEQLPAYHQDRLPPYHAVDKHLTLNTGKKLPVIDHGY